MKQPLLPGIPTLEDDSTVYEDVLKWLRRLSSLATNALVLSLAVGETSPITDVQRWIGSHVSQTTGIPPGRLLALLAIGWCLLLTQLKPRWIFFLPVYLPFWPTWLVVTTLFNLTVVPALRKVGFFGQALASPPSSALEHSRFRTLLRATWAVLFLLWALVPADPRLSVLKWIPAILWLPVWWYLLRLASKAAISPSAIVSLVTKVANGILDHKMKSFEKAVADRKRLSSGAPFYVAISGLLSRYSDHRLVAIVQKEALLYFSLVLVAALAASSVFWGLIGFAVMQTAPQLMEAYDFFAVGTLMESILWAWGCMTTTVNFPGTGAPTGIKLMHAAILGTGLFQLTFLITSFAVLTPAEAPQNANQALIALQFTRKKVEIVQDLEKKLLKDAAKV